MRRPFQSYFTVPVETIKRESPRPNACCAECRHFFPTGRDDAREGFPGCSVFGQCHRAAPDANGEFPKIFAHSFCGEFEMVVDVKLPFSSKKR